ncbi:MAG: 50S ribosomal protein L24 [Eubacteriales bacterium]|nr:50S ribosomal protein L24 [Eubacteriales bacterium]
MHVKKDQKVMVMSGKDAGTIGKVLVALPKENKVIVEGVNLITRHVKPRSAQEQGGRLKQEGAISASKVMPVCGKCNKPTRVRNKILDNGEKVRICARCGEALD